MIESESVKGAMDLFVELIRDSLPTIQKPLAKCLYEDYLALADDEDKTRYCQELAYKTMWGLAPGVMGKNKLPMTNVAGNVGKIVSQQWVDTDGDKETVNTRNFDIGYHLLYVLVQSNVIYFDRPVKAKMEEKKKEQEGKKIKSRAKYMIYIKNQEVLDDLFVVANENEIQVHSYVRPSRVKPTPYSSFYNPEAGPMIRGCHEDVISYSTIANVPQVYEVINRQMMTAYTMNEALLDIFIQCLDDDLFTKEDKDLTKEQKIGIFREQEETLRIAGGYRGGVPFWEYAFYGFRSRLYSSAVYFKHDGSKLSKSLIQMYGAKKLHANGLYNLWVHAANCAGYDKESINERYKWAMKQKDAFLEMGNNPLDNKLWQTMDDPFGFLATVMELAAAYKLEDPREYVSGHMVAWDASCSGLQVISAITRDRKSGELCNLTNTDERGDYYKMVADYIWKDLDYDDIEEDTYNKIVEDLGKLDKEVAEAFDAEVRDKALIKSVLDKRKKYYETHSSSIYAASKVFWGRKTVAKTRRKLVKRGCMTYFYSAGAETMGKAIYQDFASNKRYAGMTHSFAFFLGLRIYMACEKLMPGPTAIMDLFVKLGLDAYEKGEELKFISPLTGFMFMQPYRLHKKKQRKCRYKGRTIRPVIIIGEDDKLDYKSIKSGTSPNIVHLLDSQIVAAIVLQSKVNGYNVSCIHDSFSAVAADASMLYDDCRDAFVKLFKDDVLKDILVQLNSEHYLEDGFDSPTRYEPRDVDANGNKIGRAVPKHIKLERPLNLEDIEASDERFFSIYEVEDNEHCFS